MKRRLSHGFTLVELMIATTIFSVFLLLVASMVIQISRSYYKGVISTQTQEAARSISTEIARSIQFGSGAPTITSSMICVGSARYRYQLGKQIIDSGSPSSSQAYHNLVADDLGAGCAATGVPAGATLAANERELVPLRMRLANLQVQAQGATNLYRVTVRVVYGDDDLLNNPTTTTPTCKQQIGAQFCAVSELTTTVAKRL